MAIEYRFRCALRTGLHARPASMMAEVARRFAATMTIRKIAAGTGQDDVAVAAVDLRSVLSVVGLDVKQGEECVLMAEGADAADAVAALRKLIEHELAAGEDEPVVSPSRAGAAAEARIPIVLARLGVGAVAGRAACGGIGEGVAVIVEGLSLPPEALRARAESPERELENARRAVGGVGEELRRRAAESVGMEAELLTAHAEIAQDPALWGEVERGVREGATAARAVLAASERFSAQLRAAQSAYIRDRVVDVQDVCGQLLDRLTGGRAGSLEVRLERPSVVFGEVLTANQLLKMDRRLLKGLVLGHIGATAHTVILARSLRVPTLIDVPEASRVARPGEEAVVDGDGGFVITSVTPEVRRYYERERKTQERWRARLAPLAQQAAKTVDGQRLEIGANASTPEEVSAAVESGADGVGLLRTELLFLEREEAPSEGEQFEAYAAGVEAARGRPVIIRTFDIGGDKPAAYLDMPREENPFLGVRGLRLYEREPGLLRTQLRAIVRASAVGPVKVMTPMVALPAEARWFREQVRGVQEELGREGVAFDAKMPVGIMVEIPAAALVMDQLAQEVDFFSIGTNDLCQYWMAVDRGNAGVAGLYSARHPSFIRLLKTIVDGARAAGKWIGVCGEMAGDKLHLPLMIGLGLDEISVAPGAVLGLKTAVAAADAAKCREVLGRAAACRDAAEVENVLVGAAWRRAESAKVLEAGLIEVDVEASSKEEAIKAAVDLLFIAGRTERPREVEAAAWAREAKYSTGFGHGFAVPHCQTDAVISPTLAVVRLAGETGVDWGSMDGQPVRMLMLLAVPAVAPEAHMKIFATLARKLMHEGFRARLMGAGAAEEIMRCVRGELGLE